MSTGGNQTEEKRMAQHLCRILGGKNWRQLPNGRWTFVVRHTVTAEDLRKSGLTKPTPFTELFEARP